jgi:hypothetical protein
MENQIYRIEVPFDYAVSCSSKLIPTSKTNYLPVITPYKENTIYGRPLPEFAFLDQSKKVEYESIFKFSKRQHDSGYKETFSNEQFKALAERLRIALNIPSDFQISGGVRAGEYFVKSKALYGWNSNCISPLGESDCLIVKSEFISLCEKLNISTRTINVVSTNEDRSWLEIVPTIASISKLSASSESNCFVKDIHDQIIFFLTTEKSIAKILSGELFPLRLVRID